MHEGGMGGYESESIWFANEAIFRSVYLMPVTNVFDLVQFAVIKL